MFFTYIRCLKPILPREERSPFSDRHELRRSSSVSDPYFAYLKQVHSLFYGRGAKSVPDNIDELLTDRAVAYWAMDGTKAKAGFVLCTDSFSLYATFASSTRPPSERTGSTTYAYLS
jgi:hypothetical protein